MAFLRNDLILVDGGRDLLKEVSATAVTQYKAKQRWRYTTNDLPITVYTAGYFAGVGSTSGSAELNTYDEIEVLFDRDGTPFSKTMIVSDAAAGTVIFKTVKSLQVGPFLATDIDINGNVVTGLTLGEYSVIVGFKAIATAAITTTPCNVAFNLEIATTNVTGGVITVNAATAIGVITNATAITAGNVAGPTDAIDLEAATTTAFTEGSLAFIIQYA